MEEALKPRRRQKSYFIFVLVQRRMRMKMNEKISERLNPRAVPSDPCPSRDQKERQ
jgi:hypothetical protein